MVMASVLDPKMDSPFPKRGLWEDEGIGFVGKDKKGTIQPHDDVLVMMMQIGGFAMKRVMIDQGSGAEVMYPDLYEGLGLTLDDLTRYETSLVAFDGMK